MFQICLPESTHIVAIIELAFQFLVFCCHNKLFLAVSTYFDHLKKLISLRPKREFLS